MCFVCLSLFALWRIDNQRAERIRMALVDRFVPTIDWSFGPINSVSRIFQDFQSYTGVHQQNQELRDELQKMKGWREAAVQLEQQNARLRELNNVRLSPRLTFVTGEILADSGSPFSRILFLTDASSRVPATVRPLGQRTIVTGDNTASPPLEFIEKVEDVRPGDRVVTSGSDGIFPPDLLIGQVYQSPDGRLRVRVSADYRRLRYIRILRNNPTADIVQSDELLGPTLPPFLSPEVGE